MNGETLYFNISYLTALAQHLSRLFTTLMKPKNQAVRWYQHTVGVGLSSEGCSSFGPPLEVDQFQVRFAGNIHDGWEPWDPDNSFERFWVFVQPRILMGQSP